MSNKTTIMHDMNDIPIKRSDNTIQKEVSSYKDSSQSVRKNYHSNISEVDSPLLFASKEIFKETYRLQHLAQSSDAKGISDIMSHEIEKFSNIAAEQGVSADHILLARYILCTFIDEMLASSAWAKNSDWAGVSLLSRYFQEGYGGDKFFQLLVRFEDQPTEYIYIMELAYVCLSFGYGGKYKKKENSIQDVVAIKENLYRQIKTTKPKKDKFYANHPAAQRHHKLYSKLSRKLILAVALFLMALIYAIFTYTVQSNESSLIQILQEENSKMKETHVSRK